MKTQFVMLLLAAAIVGCGQGEAVEHLAPLVPDILIVTPIAHTPVLEVQGRRQAGDVFAEIVFAKTDEFVPDWLGDRSPCRPVFCFREGAPLGARDQQAAQLFFRIQLTERDVIAHCNRTRSQNEHSNKRRNSTD